MPTLHRLSFILIFAFVLGCAGQFALAADPGIALPATAELSDQKPGSILFYNFFTSSAASPIVEDTEIHLTNTHSTLGVTVRMWLADGTSGLSGSLALSLNAGQATSFRLSDLLPGKRGYIMAAAVDSNSACPINFNYLIGEATIKFASGHQASLAAAAVSAIANTPTACNTSIATLNFDGVNYNKLPRASVLESVASLADGNSTYLIFNRVSGSLGPGGSLTAMGTLFGVLYSDGSSVSSFSEAAAVPQFFTTLSANFPRSVPRFDILVPSGHTGWMRVFNSVDVAMLGAAINYNPNATTQANRFVNGHNFTHQTLTTATLTIPVGWPDLTIFKSHTGNFTVGGTGAYNITVTNFSPSIAGGTLFPIGVLDDLPAPLKLSGYSGTGWTCTGIGTNTAKCQNSTILSANASLPVLTLNVAVNGPPQNVENVASVKAPPYYYSGYFDDNNPDNDSAFDPTTILCPAAIVDPSTIPAAFVGVPYSQSFTPSGVSGTVVWSVVGSLPAGLTLSSAGVLSGTPTAAGSATFTIKATGNYTCFGQRQYTLTVSACPTVTFTPTSLPNGILGQAYNQSLTASGGAAPYSFSVISGNLPPNVSLSATGAFTGAPTASGNFNFTVRATAANNCFGDRSYTMTVVICSAISIAPATLHNGFVDTLYHQTLTASGGMSPYAFTIVAGALPNGLNLASGGVLSGAPTANGTFNFAVKAMDANGCTGTLIFNLTISGKGFQFYPLAAPVRLLDTRAGASPTACSQPNAPIAAGTVRHQLASGFCGIPGYAAAITGNVTTVNSGGGFLTMYPSGAPRPTVATTNFGANQVVNNVFTVGIGVGGNVDIYALTTTDIVVDITGYYALPGASGLYFHTLPTPVRLLETRVGQTVGCIRPGAPLTANTETTFTATGNCTDIPTTARAIVGNATTVSPQAGGYLTLFPANAALPLVASSNYDTDQIVNGPFTAGLSSAGQFKIFTSATTHLVVDVLGYYSTDAEDVNGAGLLFTPLSVPVRLLETRADQTVGCFRPGAPLNSGQVYSQSARGVCGVATIPANALGVVGNATVVLPAGGGYLTLWPSTAEQPTTATSNYNVGQVVNRHFIVGLGAGDGAFKMFSSARTELVIDLSGYFAP
ncbi:MAG TPA: putative Ig domain-containing protein [Blastocatellia bacterium]|nr:putative Ig domain-containing protein [Blastocatellia bacterium]